MRTNTRAAIVVGAFAAALVPAAAQAAPSQTAPGRLLGAFDFGRAEVIGQTGFVPSCTLLVR